LGIGTNNPQNKLHVTGEIRSAGYSNSNGIEGEPSYAFTNDPDTGMWRGSNVDFLRFSTGGNEAITIDPSQNVGIGYTTPTQRLDVNGSIRANNDFISGATTLTVPDYVFETYFVSPSLTKPYQFYTLEKVEAHLREHLHLPGIPSAKEVKKSNQWNITRATLNNLEKIEELFLHTIEQEKKIERLQDQNTQLSKELEDLKTRLNRLEQLLENNKDH
jgi:hypothetical protein